VPPRQSEEASQGLPGTLEAGTEAFVRHIQAAIVGTRSVTFLLQAAKRHIPGFESWYAGWQGKMRQDRVLRWLVDTRNKIEKVGDIEPASTLRMTFSRSWLDDGNNVLNVPASYTAMQAADLFAKLIEPRSKIEESLIRFQREVSPRLAQHRVIRSPCILL
jgi:hypothetical protein